MGMFDYVKCARIMPDGLDGNVVEFQTKDFDCGMYTLEINDAGRLIESAWIWDGVVPKEDRPYGHEPDGSPMLLIGSMKSKQLPPTDLNFHGLMSFYGPDKDGKWHEYEAKFTDGTLVEIKAIAEESNQ